MFRKSSKQDPPPYDYNPQNGSRVGPPPDGVGQDYYNYTRGVPYQQDNYYQGPPQDYYMQQRQYGPYQPSNGPYQGQAAYGPYGPYGPGPYGYQQGYYPQQRRKAGFLEALLAGLACCCCLDLIF